ncbi:MAG TPA: DUF2269 family protein [Solirubrobacterales bacterium]|nr:DUF2269 family protein [Solirubrobacterales bacterium]
MDNVVLFFHLAGALLFVAGTVVAGIAFESARRREDPSEIALLLGLARSAVPLVLLGGILLLGCGLWLAGLEEDAGLGAGWVNGALALFVLALALGGWGGRAPRRARELAERQARGEEADADLRALLEDPRSRLANYASAALIVAILALMVFKP